MISGLKRNPMRFDLRQVVTFGELATFVLAWLLGIAATLPDSTLENLSRRVARLTAPMHSEQSPARLD